MIIKFSLFEGTDHVLDTYNGVKYDAYYLDPDAIPFIYTTEHEFIFGGERTEHSENENFYPYYDSEMIEYSGRYWEERKVISLWDEPKNIPEFFDIFSETLGIDLYDDWVIEEYNKIKDSYKLVSIQDFEGTDKNELAYIEHLKKQSDKEREKQLLIKQGKDPLKGYKGGSKFRSDKVDKDKMSKAQYHSIIHPYESRVMTFEAYHRANPDILDKTPVVDYVDTEYYNTDVEKDDKELPNPTGTTDMQTKNKTKKAIYKQTIS
jgi:hypothetical protein